MSNFSQRVCRKVREYYLIKISVTIEVKYSKIFSFLKKKCFVVFFCFVLLLVSHQSFLLSLCQWPHSTTDKRIQPKKSKERERERSKQMDTECQTEGQEQCDQIGRFNALWATFQSLWQQLFYPNRPDFLAIFVNLSKSLIFLVEIIYGQLLQTFDDFYWSHWLGEKSVGIDREIQKQTLNMKIAKQKKE